MKLIYVAGPYRNDIEHRVWQNIMLARDVAMQIWQAGGVPIVPHLNSMLMGGLVDIEQFLKGDCEIISRCDALMLIGLWNSSEGSQIERRFAEEKDIPVFTLMGDVRDFLRDTEDGSSEERG